MRKKLRVDKAMRVYAMIVGYPLQGVQMKTYYEWFMRDLGLQAPKNRPVFSFLNDQFKGVCIDIKSVEEVIKKLKPNGRVSPACDYNINLKPDKSDLEITILSKKEKLIKREREQRLNEAFDAYRTYLIDEPTISMDAFFAMYNSREEEPIKGKKKQIRPLEYVKRKIVTRKQTLKEKSKTEREQRLKNAIEAYKIYLSDNPTKTRDVFFDTYNLRKKEPIKPIKKLKERRPKKEKRNKYKDYLDYIDSHKWREKRQEAFMFYGEFCHHCNAIKELHVHHITYESLFNEKMEDLMVLCKTCHFKLHDEINRAKKEYVASLVPGRITSTPVF